MSGPTERQANPAALVTRTGPRHLDWLRQRLSVRDWAILLDLDRLRLLSADHIERLHFSSRIGLTGSLTGLTGRSREVVRGRVLHRLVDWRVITALGRRIGGSRRGSARTVYALDTAGQRLVRQRQAAEQPTARVRRPSQVGERFQAHTLAVSELYVALATGASLSTAGTGSGGAATGMTLAVFDAEPGAWWPDGLRGWLKPDAYLRLSSSAFDDHWWVEVDRATESLPTLKRKLECYRDFYQRGQLGPDGVMPRVLVSTISEQRREAIGELVGHLGEPAGELFVVALDREAASVLLNAGRG